MDSGAVASLDRRTLRERCLSELRTAITTGRFAPGDHLGEVELASAFGVSRGTVREALRHLQQERLVVAGARGMLRVRSQGPQEILDIYQVRAALEALAAETLTRAEGREDVVRVLRAEVDGITDAGGDLAARMEADLGFHRRLCELSGNDQLLASWRFLEGPIRITMMHAGPRGALDNMDADRHISIVDAIAAGDPAVVREVVFEHMTMAAERLAGAGDHHPR